MDELLSPSDITASPGLISPLKYQTNNNPIQQYEIYEEDSEKRVRDMTYQELIDRLDGKVDMGWQWVLVIIIFIILIILFVPILIGAGFQALNAERINNGVVKYVIYELAAGSTETIAPSSNTSYIMNVDYGNSQSNNTIQSTLFIDGSNGRSNLFNGSYHVFTATSSHTGTGTFSSMLTVRSVTPSEFSSSAVVYFVTLDGHTVSSFNIENASIGISGTTISTTASRTFVWTQGNILIEINSTDRIKGE